MLLDNGTIITMNKDREIQFNSSVVIKGNKIIDIGDKERIKEKYSKHKRIDCAGQVILPGFINIHTHSALCLVRGMAEDRGLAPAYTKSVPRSTELSEEELYYLSMLGAMEALKFGSTLIVDNYISSQKNVEAFAKLGLRAVVSERVHDVEFSQLSQGKYEYSREKGQKLLNKNLELIEKWHNKNNGRIKCIFGPHAPDSCSEELLKEISRYADQYDLGMNIHLAQSQDERDYIMETKGMTPVEYLYNTEILRDDLIAAHCIYVNQKDIELLTETQTNIAHIPEGNAKGGMMAPVDKMRKEDLNLTLGTDNMQGDMIDTMRFAICIGRILNNSCRNPTSMEILEMATINGAKALGLEDQLGSIEKGKKADLVILDFQKPHLTPTISPVGNLIHTANGNDVEKVIIDGEIVVDDGQIVNVNQKDIMEKADSIAKDKWRKVIDNYGSDVQI